MSSVVNLEIHAAQWTIMSGSIEFTVRPHNSRWRVTMQMGDGFHIIAMAPYGKPFRDDDHGAKITPEMLIELIGGESRWTFAGFSGVWMGFSAGFERGVNSEKYKPTT